MTKSCAASIASLTPADRAAFLDSLSDNALAAMPYLWSIWANPLHQLAPEGDWATWVILGGRGAGKTRAGAEWIRDEAEGARPNLPGRSRRIALIGETTEQVRAVMVEGESGILSCSPPDRRPVLLASRNLLVWPNGAEASLVSATNYEALRGPQFDCAWADELAKWRYARDAWDMLQFTLRLGEQPRQVVTTTPRDTPVLREILADPRTVVSRAGTEANRANLAPGFLDRLQDRYGGTWLGRQELDGVLLEEREGALWTRQMIEAARAPAPDTFDRVVVAVDPPVSTGNGADACGIVVAGLQRETEHGLWCAWVLADETVRGLSPRRWARRALDAYEDHGADRMVAEVNQGGDLVESIVRQLAPSVSYRAVHARRGKRLRAEPVSSLYEQGRVFHARAFPELEDEMCSFGAEDGLKHSPDRLDALVWALTDLVIDPQTHEPRVRGL